MTTFKNYQFKDFIFDTLDKMNFKNPTPIQELVIPLALQGKDVIGKSPTGSGKTHAYLLPILNKIDTSIDKVQAVILTPTRELATQIYENLVMFQKYDQKLKLRLITGGLDRTRMIEKVNNTPHIVIGTPGRIKDIGLDKAEFNLMSTDILVLDEADMIMETGFMDDVSLLAAKMKDDLQMLVFSATIPNHLKVFLDKYMHNPKLVELSNINPGTITHVAYPTRHHNRKDVLLNVINGINPYLCLIFASKKDSVNEIYNYLLNNGHKVGIIHGDLDNKVRRQMMRRIKDNEFVYIVCSDIAARGIDIEGVSHVINYDLPKELEFFYHRAGRTGRNGNDGICYTFYDKEDLPIIMKLMKGNINFLHQEYKNNEWVDLKSLTPETKKKEPTELDLKIKTIVNKSKKQPVKPGYKKKAKEEIEKVKAKHRREIIKKDIKKRIKERAIERTKREKGEY